MSERRLTLSVPEAAQALGIGLNSVYRAVQDGRLPAIKVGRKPRLRIPRAAIQRLVKNPAVWAEDGER